MTGESATVVMPATWGRRPLDEARRLDLALEGAATAMPVSCSRVRQRNWSRVARASAAGGRALFLKQFIDRRGEWHEDHWHYEAHGTAVAQRALGGLVRVPALLHRSPESVTLGYEHLDIVAFDDLLRAEPGRFEERRQALLTGLGELMEGLVRAASEDLGDLPTKARAYDTGRRALCFKGLDVRNLGCLRQADELVAFDFGRPYLAPVEEAAAKLLVSVGLLNWGRPLARFVRGPDRQLFVDAAHVLAPWTGLAATRAELELQRAVRTETIQGRRIEGALKRWGVHLLGRRYLVGLEALCEEHVA